MSVITKIILDTNEYNRLLAIEKAYNELKTHQVQGGSGKEKCTCVSQSSTPPLSEIIAKNELAHTVDIPPRGILPSITDPNDTTNPTGSGKPKNTEENFDANNFRALGNEKDAWYFLGHFEEK